MWLHGCALIVPTGIGFVSAGLRFQPFSMRLRIEHRTLNIEYGGAESGTPRANIDMTSLIGC